MVKSMLLSTMLLLCATVNGLKENFLTELGQSFQNCSIAVGDVTSKLVGQGLILLLMLINFLVFSCDSNYLIYPTERLLRGDTSVLKFANADIMAANANLGVGVTYVLDKKKIYRGYEVSGTIQQDYLLEINYDIFNTQIQSIYSDDGVILVKYSNQSIHLYTYDSSMNVLFDSTDSIQFTNSVNLFMHVFKGSSESTLMELMTTPNYQDGNVLRHYNVEVSRDSNGKVTNAKFVLVKEDKTGVPRVSSIGISKDFVAIGCDECNEYYGLVDIQNRSYIFQQLYSHKGDDSNLYYGSQIDVIESEELTRIYVTSHSKAFEAERVYYINMVEAIKDFNGGFVFKLTEKVLTPTIENNSKRLLLYGLYSDRLVMKYQAQNKIFSFVTCSFSENYSRLDGNYAGCVRCGEFEYTLQFQDNVCTSCRFLMDKKEDTTSYEGIVYQKRCKDYFYVDPVAPTPVDPEPVDPKDPEDETPGVITDDPKPDKGGVVLVNQSLPGTKTSDNKNKVWKLIILITAILFIVIVVGIICIYCCRSPDIYDENTPYDVSQIDPKYKHEKIAEEDSPYSSPAKSIQTQDKLGSARGSPGYMSARIQDHKKLEPEVYNTNLTMDRSMPERDSGTMPSLGLSPTRFGGGKNGNQRHITPHTASKSTGYKSGTNLSPVKDAGTDP